MIRKFENLEAWKHAIELAIKIYKITKDFPREEIYGLTSQIRRASVSVSSNIAEGSGYGTNKGFIRYLRISIGSLNEVKSLAIISNKLGHIKNDEFDDLKDEIDVQAKISYGLINYLKSKN